MSLKNATLIAMLGITVSFVISLLNILSIMAMSPNPRTLLSLLSTICLHGSLLFFLRCLYRGS